MRDIVTVHHIPKPNHTWDMTLLRKIAVKLLPWVRFGKGHDRSDYFFIFLGAPFPAPRVDDWWKDGQNTLTSAMNQNSNTNVAKNVIIFIGDGMDITTITASRIYGGQKQGKSGEENKLTFEKFPNVALSKVRSFVSTGKE